LGFQVGFGPESPDRTNDSGVTYYYVAFGPHIETYYRSIGTLGATPHNAGTIAATVGSPVVTGVGTGWKTANRGRGDSITFGGFTGRSFPSTRDPAHAHLSLSRRGSPPYAISASSDLAAWENCIDGGGSPGPRPRVSTIC
jgi:hypothetical protein